MAPSYYFDTIAAEHILYKRFRLYTLLQNSYTSLKHTNLKVYEVVPFATCPAVLISRCFVLT